MSDRCAVVHLTYTEENIPYYVVIISICSSWLQILVLFFHLISLNHCSIILFSRYCVVFVLGGFNRREKFDCRQRTGRCQRSINLNLTCYCSEGILFHRDGEMVLFRTGVMCFCWPPLALLDRIGTHIHRRSFYYIMYENPRNKKIHKYA